MIRLHAMVEKQQQKSMRTERQNVIHLYFNLYSKSQH